jgi:PEP-CTERM motif
MSLLSTPLRASFALLAAGLLIAPPALFGDIGHDDVLLNTAGLEAWPPGSFVFLNVLFAEPGAAVPAPGSLALAGLGLMTMVVCRPRRQDRPPRFGPSLGTA